MKYKLTDNKKDFFKTTLFQIEATADFGDVSKGDLGGWIEKEENLSQEGNAWVYGNARVYGNAQVYGNALVYGNAQVYGKLKLSLGYFFGFRYKKEEIKYVKLDEDYELVCKGEIKVDETPEVKEMTVAEISKALGFDVKVVK